MKKQLLLFLMVMMISLISKSQTSVYHPFPEDSAAWLTDVYYNTCMGYCSSVYDEMKGDTIINSQIYHKIFQREGQFHYIAPPPNSVVGASFNNCSYVGAIRQDSINKKVYFIDSTMITDTLFYDFNLTIGDSIQDWYNKSYMQWPLIVSGIDSVSINNSYHKIFYFQNYPNQRNLIEGVGWSGELFGLQTFALETRLACFNGENDVSQGMIAFINECDVSLNCSIFLSIAEQSENKHFNLFPNPFSDKLNFNISNNELSEIFIYDISSRKLLQEKFINSISFNTEKLAKGLYFYEIRNKDGSFRAGKVVKN